MAAGRSRYVRKRHVQQGLFNHGGKRKGGGRKPQHGRSGTSHAKRDGIDGADVLHVVLRAVADVGNLRRREVYKAVRAATVTASRRDKFRIVQLSIQHNHVHMLVEAESAEDLSIGMQGFLISAARRINTALRVGARRRRGSVFADRYHVVVIRSPRQARNVLAYVLGNWRKHGEDRHGVARRWFVDPFSSAILFADWKELEDQAPWAIPAGYEPLVVTPARSWLLCIGRKRHGAISVYEVPGQRRASCAQ
jgi:putative transposase